MTDSSLSPPDFTSPVMLLPACRRRPGFWPAATGDRETPPIHLLRATASQAIPAATGQLRPASGQNCAASQQCPHDCMPDASAAPAYWRGFAPSFHCSTAGAPCLIATAILARGRCADAMLDAVASHPAAPAYHVCEYSPDWHTGRPAYASVYALPAGHHQSSHQYVQPGQTLQPAGPLAVLTSPAQD